MNVLYVYAAPLEGEAIEDRLGITARLGVGKAAAACSLARALSTRPRPDAVILFGIGGAYPERHRAPGASALSLLDVCVVATDVLADEGVLMPEGFKTLDEMGFGSNGPYHSDPALTKRLQAILRCPLVRGATVSTCSGDDTLSNAIAKRTSATIESMEGAAVALVCQSFGVPFAQLRVVSNETGDRARGGWDLMGAVRKLQSATLEVRAAL